MATKIVTKNSSTASAVPTASDLVQGELAVNVADKRLFTEDNAGAIVELGTNPYNFTANHDGSAKLATTSTGIDVTGTAVADSYDIGSLGTLGSVATDRLFIATADGLGLQFDFDNSRIVPVGADGSTYNNNVSLGSSGLEFKNLLLSGNATVGGTATMGGLVVQQPSGANILLESTTTGATTGDIFGEIEFKTNDSSSAGVKGKIDSYSEGGVGNGALRLFTGNTTGLYERLRIASDGSLSTPTLGTSNVRFGVNAGNSIVSGGVSNVLLGDEAGTAITTGSYNVIAGHRAGDALNTGSNNVALGWAALTLDTKGDKSTAVGRSALASQNFTSSTDAYNVAVGYLSGAAVTTGTQNTLIGGLAGDAITTASNNTAVGYASLTANTTGIQNTAVGGLALNDNTTASLNTAIGYSALKSTTTGGSNTAVGLNALVDNTTGARNTASGQQALTANTTASDNTAFGYQSLLANTTGTNNTAVGTFALDASTTASNNTAVGYSALTDNTSGTYNTAVGSLALENTTAGFSNTAVGGQALQGNTTGRYNTAMGVNALDKNTTAHGNTGLAAGALAANTTGASNTAVGQNALTVNTTGGSNTAIGYNAGGAITTGHANLCVGYNAGDYQTTLTSGTGNVLVGPFCDVVSATANDQHAFGYNLDAASGYTTLGNSANDIRAAFGNVTWATVSDQRYKKDIVDSTAGLSFINALQPRTFKYKTLGELPETFRAYEADSTEVFKNSDTNHGFIAQEVKAAIDADSSIKDGFRLWDDREDGSQEVAEAALIPVLVKAIQELSTQLDAALARIETLEG